MSNSRPFTATGFEARPSTSWCSGALPPDSLSEVGAAGSEAGNEPAVSAPLVMRSEERRVGKECRTPWSPYPQKKKQLTNMLVINKFCDLKKRASEIE